MKSLHIRNLEEETLAGLKVRAKRHHRSLQKEVEVLLKDAASMVAHVEPVPLMDRLHTVKTGETNGTWSREEIYGDDGR